MNPVLKVAGVDLSIFTKDLDPLEWTDQIPAPTYGNPFAVGQGLANKKLIASGVYDSDKTRLVPSTLQPLYGAEEFSVEAGDSHDDVVRHYTAILEDFVCSEPVAGYVMWSATFHINGNGGEA